MIPCTKTKALSLMRQVLSYLSDAEFELVTSPSEMFEGYNWRKQIKYIIIFGRVKAVAEIIQIDEQTWRLEDDFVRFFLLEGEERAVLIDSGANCPDAADLAKSLTDKPVMLLNTHGDGDHVSGTGGFAEIHIHPDDYVRCEVNTRYPDTSLAEIRDGDVIDLGGRPLRIIHIPGHTLGSVAILDEKRHILYAGDSVQKGHIYMFGTKRDPEQFESSLSKLISFGDEYDRIYASHDEFLLPGDYAEKVKTAWKQVRNAEVGSERISVHGSPVRSYTTPYCGFYLNL